MANRFASGKNSIAMCDRCGARFKLTELRKEIIKTKTYNLLVCGSCWDPDQPQLQLGMYPVDDPQAVRNPRHLYALLERTVCKQFKRHVDRIIARSCTVLLIY
jgi:hypothetical protein